MENLIETLLEDHLKMGRLLAALDHQIEVFASGEAPDYDVVVGVAEYFLDYPDKHHHPKEEVIAAKLAEIDPAPSINAADLARAHQTLHRHAQDFREAVRVLLIESDISRDTIVQAARRFMDAESAHMRAEEADLFVRANALLEPEDWIEIEAALGQGRDPSFGGAAIFRTRSERLLAWEAEDEDSSAAP